VPDLPKAACALLDKEYVRSTSVVEKAQKSSDGSTCKLLVRLQDGMQVEAVVMTYDKDGAGTCASFLYTEFPSDDNHLGQDTLVLLLHVQLYRAG
jgi:adenine C2-methylase RlmN of 23S rRNA A2503 and tRNA A37